MARGSRGQRREIARPRQVLCTALFHYANGTNVYQEDNISNILYICICIYPSELIYVDMAGQCRQTMTNYLNIFKPWKFYIDTKNDGLEVWKMYLLSIMATV